MNSLILKTSLSWPHSSCQGRMKMSCMHAPKVRVCMCMCVCVCEGGAEVFTIEVINPLKDSFENFSLFEKHALKMAPAHARTHQSEKFHVKSSEGYLKCRNCCWTKMLRVKFRNFRNFFFARQFNVSSSNL